TTRNSRATRGEIDLVGHVDAVVLDPDPCATGRMRVDGILLSSELLPKGARLNSSYKAGEVLRDVVTLLDRVISSDAREVQERDCDVLER
ncbi:MAG TPA: hypothetical protein VFO62_09035, partial [Candidatus Binatia bacterium]|nr:hypothetical protein [Candidatus Binatia bacterium]